MRQFVIKFITANVPREFTIGDSPSNLRELDLEDPSLEFLVLYGSFPFTCFI